MTLVGKVETYLADVIDTMRATLNDITSKSVVAQKTNDRNTWLKMDPAQVTLVVNMITWCETVEAHFHKLKGNQNAMKECLDHQIEMLTALIKIVQGKIDSPFRQKVMCLITMDTHSRDIIDKLYVEKVRAAEEF